MANILWNNFLFLNCKWSDVGVFVLWGLLTVCCGQVSVPHLWAVSGVAQTPKRRSSPPLSLGGPLFLCLPRLVHGGVCWREGAARGAVQARWTSVSHTSSHEYVHRPGLIGHHCCLCRRTCDLVVQERGGEDGLWHSECLENIWHQQQVQVKEALFM